MNQMLDISRTPDPRDFDSGTANALAIVGMSCRFAGARSLDDYWQLLSAGREGVEDLDEAACRAAGVSPSVLRSPAYIRRAAPLADMECFDATLFGISPRDAAIMDPQHRHFLECCWEALENAGHVPHRFDGAIGVFAGSGHNAYMPNHLLGNRRLMRDVGLFLLRHTSNDKDFLTTRVSYLLDLTGPSINVQTACSTSLVAVHMAAQSLLSGECDMAIAGGASIELPHRQGYLYHPGEILSPDGHCRPFDAQSQGTVFGSGIGVVVLRRLADAIEAGDHIYAVLRGSAINNDGAGKVGYLAPSVDGQARVIAEAMAIAQVEADTIDYVEAHGTGTPVGDPIEIAALTQAFRETSDRVGDCAIGSVKANIGHTDTAAGAAGLIKIALSLHHQALPPSINYAAPNPACGFADSPFVVHDKLTPWRCGKRPRRAGLSSLGVGGTNAHAIIEEAPLRAPGSPSRPLLVLPVSARSADALSANLQKLSTHLAGADTGTLADTAYTLSTGRHALSLRRFVVAETPAEAALALAEIAESKASPPTPCIPDRPVAFLFCGAGAQHVDMARTLYETEARFRGFVDDSLGALEQMGLPEIRRWLFPVDADRERAVSELERPSIALPALFTIQVALARFWMALGVRPSGMIGHSSGEYAAAHLAGVVDLQSALRIVVARGQLFETVERGGMLSVPLSEAELLPMLPDGLSIAAVNAPRLCVVSGASDAIRAMRDALADQEIEAQIVRIAVAAHSSMLDPILPSFRALMETITLRPPQLPFVSNVTGDWISDAEATSADYWVRHLRQTVRFTDGLQRLLGDPARVLLEVGPGRSMSSLARQHPDRPRNQPVVSTLPHPDQQIADHRFFWSTLGDLWTLGAPVDWDAYWQGERRLRIPLPTYSFDRQRHWFDPAPVTGDAAAAGEPPERIEDERDWFFTPVWQPGGEVQPAIPDGTALILDDGNGMGAALAAALRAAGRPVVSVRPGRRFTDTPEGFDIDPGCLDDYDRMARRLADTGRFPTQVYHCWGVTGRRRVATQKGMERGFFSLASLAPALARHAGDARVRIALVTDGAQRVATDPAPAPAKAAAIGAAPVIAAEYPALTICPVDIERPRRFTQDAFSAAAQAVIRELAGAEQPTPVAIRAGARWVRDYQPVRRDAADAPTSIRRDGAYLITGGLGGIGLTIARSLAARGARIALIARTPLPPREQWPDAIVSADTAPVTADRIRKLLALEASGARVELVVADVADAKAMRRAVAHIHQSLGPVRGVFHTAGTLDDGLLDDRSRAAMEAVLRPKVDGTLALESALFLERPDFVLLFSSISAFAGLPGQTDYAAANAFLDAYADARRDDPHTRVVSIGWSRWQEVGMAARLGGADMVAPIPDTVEGGTPIDHPFLDTLHRLSAECVIASGTLSPDRHWLLGEHRLSGVGALIPGTGYLELVRATFAAIQPGGFTISDMLFLAPFAVTDGANRSIRVRLDRQAAGGWRFAVLGLGDDGKWLEHASGTISSLDEAAVPILDIAGLRAACPDQRRAGRGKSALLQFGARWDNVMDSACGAGRMVLRQSLPAAFADDLASVALHPALLDMATAGGQTLIPGYDEARDFFAPFGYRRIVVHAPLPAAFASYIRYRGPDRPGAPTATFDVTIADTEGRVLAEISEFVMIRVSDTARMIAAPAVRAANDAARPAVADQQEGILSAQGLSAIDRLLAGPPAPHLVVSPYPLNALLSHLRAPRKAAARVQQPGDAQVELPVTPTECAIAAIWEDLLGTAPIGRHDDFFELGGHSLLAVQFANRFRRQTGKTLPLSAMLDSPTVGKLAALVDPAEAASDQPSGSQPPALVTIRAGGAGLPLFMIHDGLGETLLYRGLALRLDGARTVYGIEPLRTPGGGYAHTRIDEMATDYIARLRTIQPHGPYLIGGLCAGGVIAFEMARQLEDAGEPIAFVGIIDAADVAATRRHFYLTRQRLRRLQQLFAEGRKSALVSDIARRASNALIWEVQSRYRRELDRRRIRNIEQTRPDTQVIDFLPLYEDAHRRHRPSGLLASGQVTLFRATQGSGDIKDVPYQEIYSDVVLGWGRRIAEDISVVPVPGGHGSALQEPHVDTLAAHFQTAIDNALAAATPHPGRTATPLAIAAE